MNTCGRIFITLGALTVIVLVVSLAAAAWRDYRRCIDNGGHWEHINCHDVAGTDCHTIDFGNGSASTVCYPTTHTECDRVCHGASSEVR